MARFIVVAALVALASTSAFAQTAPADFVTVDSVVVENFTLRITGIPVDSQSGETRLLTFHLYTGSEAIHLEQLRTCKEFAFVAMSKPGQYRLRAYPSSPVPVCGLVRVIQ